MKNYLKKNENSETEERKENKERIKQLKEDREYLHNLFKKFWREDDDKRIHEIIYDLTRNYEEENDRRRYEYAARLDRERSERH